MHTKMSFREFMDEPSRLLHEGMLAFYKLWLQEAEQPVLMDPKQGLDLQFPGKHLQGVLPRGKVYRPDVKPSTKQNLAGVMKGANGLVKISDLRGLAGSPVNEKKPTMLSHFVRDQPFIAAYSQANPENMASTIIFVLMTIRADFMQVMQDFPVVMIKLMTDHQDYMDVDLFKQGMEKLQGKLAMMSSPKQTQSNKEGKMSRKGYSTNSTIFGTKWKAVGNVWSNRAAIYANAMSYVSKPDTVGLFSYLLNNISGLAQAKAGFCVQLIFGELGCIDMHNVNLYSQYYLNRGQERGEPIQASHEYDPIPGPADPEDRRRYTKFDPSKFSKKPRYLPDQAKSNNSKDLASYEKAKGVFAGKVSAYIDMLKELEDSGFNTIKLWDIWVAYVSNAYKTKTGGSRYSRQGVFAGNPINPDDPTDKAVMGVQEPVPDRNAILTGHGKIDWVKDPNTGAMVPMKRSKGGNYNPLDTYSITGTDTEQSAGAASLAHGATWWWRQPDYWWDALHQAEAEADKKILLPKDIFRYSSGGGKWSGEKRQKGEKKYEAPSTAVSKPLAYIAIDDNLMRTVFPDLKDRQAFSNRLNDVLRKMNFFWRPPTPHI